MPMTRIPSLPYQDRTMRQERQYGSAVFLGLNIWLALSVARDIDIYRVEPGPAKDQNDRSRPSRFAPLRKQR